MSLTHDIPDTKINQVMAVTDTQESHGLADPVMLGKIDKLFACNVGAYIDLPQLVVIGDQSSGKSSVLEGLTNLPFPRDSSLCTRFATQITFRRSMKKTVLVSIIPAKDGTDEHAQIVRGWGKEIESLGPVVFAEIMREVQIIMGLSEVSLGTYSGTSKTFSNDVLCLEVCGPDEEHLSVFDVPGIFKATTLGVTTKADIDMVERMVWSYMKNPRSVMLTVIPANIDVATQSILEMAEEVDPDGQRTLGVLTKPDLVDKGAEQGVVDLLEGKRRHLALGWTLLRNLGQQQSTDPGNDRHAVEKKFFDSVAPWNSLEKERVGIEALQMRLQEILAAHIRREFPKVKSELNGKLRACKDLLSNLGPKRESSAEKMSYLIGIAIRFQEIVTLAKNADYSRDELFDKNPDLRFITQIVNRTELLSQAFALYGHTFEFKSQQLAHKDQDAATDTVDVNDEDSPSMTTSATSDSVDGKSTRTTETHAELADILLDKYIVSDPKPRGIMDWLMEVYHSSRGFELGMFDLSLLAITMKAQSKKWDNLAVGYVCDVVSGTHSFIDLLLRLICPDERVRNGLKSLLMDELVHRYKQAIDQAYLILRVERLGLPLTFNHYFNDNLEKCRQERMRKAMAAKSISDCSHGTIVRLNDIVQNHPMSNSEHVVQDLHDILQSYYKVARKRIVDVITMQAVDHHLVTGPLTPLQLFSPAFVGTMTAGQLEEVAGEDPILVRRRKQLQKEVADLELGKKILS